MAPKPSPQPAPQPAPLDKRREAHHFWRGQVGPRLPLLRRERALRWSVLAGVVCSALVSFMPVADTEISALAGHVISYVAISFGACITALVLAIGLAPQQRVNQWATTYAPGRKFSTFSELVFVLTWAAMTQLLALFAMMAAVLIGAEELVMPDDPVWTHRPLFAGAAALVVYSAWHLVTVISTLSQIGSVTNIEAARASDEPIDSN